MIKLLSIVFTLWYVFFSTTVIGHIGMPEEKAKVKVSKKGGEYKIIYNGGINSNNLANQIYRADRRGARVIKIFITSPGGYNNYGLNLKHRLLKTRAKTIFIVKNRCSSMCAVSLQYADEVRLSPNARIMFHMIHDGSRPFTIYDVEPRRRASAHRFIKRFLVPTIKNKWLTKEEYNAMLRGKDVVIKGRILMKRIYR